MLTRLVINKIWNTLDPKTQYIARLVGLVLSLATVIACGAVTIAVFNSIFSLSFWTIAVGIIIIVVFIALFLLAAAVLANENSGH